MTFRPSLALLVCLTLWRASSALADEPVNQLSAAEQEAGFVLMFNGKDLDGWEHSGNWIVQADGAIHRASKGSSLTYVAHELPPDFELRFDWKVAAGSNSGVYYRPGQYEYQVLDNSLHKDGQNPRTSAASLYFCMAPSKDNTQPVGEWNEGRIICKGSVIKHHLNGEAVVDFDYNDPRWAYHKFLLKLRGGDLDQRGGRVSLQDHNDPVWYRNLRFRAIPAEEMIQPAQDF